MPVLRLAITVVEIIIGVIVVLLLGDYLGYKLGRRKLLSYSAIAALISVIGFAIFAAIVLL